MLPKRFRPMASRARRMYVEVMFQVMGRALQAISEVDANVQDEARVLPEGFLFEMKVLPNGSALVIEHTGDGRLHYHGTTAPGPVNLSIQFKHLVHAFLVLSFQEKTAVAFAHQRMLVDGDIAQAIRMTRILSRLEAFILPQVIANHAVKEYPANLHLPEKLFSGARIYLKTASLFIDTVRA